MVPEALLEKLEPTQYPSWRVASFLPYVNKVHEVGIMEDNLKQSVTLLSL